MKKNILILYTNYGTGHYMAAKAIEEYIINKYPNMKVELLDALSYSRPKINKLFAKIGKIVATKFRNYRMNLYKQTMYKKYLKYSPFYKLCIKIFWTKKLKKKITEFNPNIIISTQVGPTGLIAAHKDLFNAKIISVFTDYSIHRMYTAPHEFVDLYCVPTIEIKNDMIKIGIKEDKIKVTGIPVRSNFLIKEDKEKLINELKLPKDKKIFLFICGGGLGYNNAFPYFEKILQSKYDCYYIFVSGKNTSLKEKAQVLANKYQKEGKILGYVNEIDKYIKCSDIVFGKPGGIITSETLNLGIPLCAIEPIPGQEIKNALYISNNKYGFYIKTINDFETFLNDLKNNIINIDEYKQNIKKDFINFTFNIIDK